MAKSAPPAPLGPDIETDANAARALLAPLRAEIDALDEGLVSLMGRRFAVVRRVAALKAAHGIQPILPDRIEEVVAHARNGAERAAFDPLIAERIYRILIDGACRLEADLIAAGEAEQA